VNAANKIGADTAMAGGVAVSLTQHTPSSATNAATNAVASKPKMPRRKRVNYGVLTVVNATKATFANIDSNSNNSIMQPGDILLSINKRSVGGWTFHEACRAIGSTSTVCSKTGVVCCVLKVARMKNDIVVAKKSCAAVKPLYSGLSKAAGGGHIGIQGNPVVINPSASLPSATPMIIPMIPFNAFGDKVVSGEFSDVEWTALIRSLSQIPHQLFSGMALISVSQKEVLAAAIQKKEYGKSNPLQRRSIQVLEAKLAHESKRIALEMKQKAQKYWTLKWQVEVQKDAENENNALFVDNVGLSPPLTDARRSSLREAARPSKGCKCGSATHEFVNDAQCLLYRDVKQYCDANSIIIQDDNDVSKNREMMRNINGASSRNEKTKKNAMEKAHIDRFMKLRAESAATMEEAKFVLEMEKVQSSRMKKAVFAPSLLCTLILSAVASVMDLVPEEGPPAAAAPLDGDSKLLDGEKDAGGDARTQEEDENKMDVISSSTTNKQSSGSDDQDDDSDDDDSDEEDLPLNSLLQTSSKRPTATNNSNSPPPKRSKLTEAPASVNEKTKTIVAPSPYFLAEILRHVSQTHGHIFQEPTHSDFAWQQRHRSTLTAPLPKEVMFKGNPRAPGSLSFENIRFLLNEERMSRLRSNWQNPKPKRQLPQPTSLLDSDTKEKWNDEWIVTHLSSDAMTGLRHEVDTLVCLGVLSVEANGKLVLAQGWQHHIPHMVLNEMKGAWGTEVDVNLFCIHDRIKTALESQWDCVEGGWRLASDDNDMVGDDDDELVFEDEEYELRKQIFTENYTNWVSEKSGMGEFGV